MASAGLEGPLAQVSLALFSKDISSSWVSLCGTVVWHHHISCILPEGFRRWDLEAPSPRKTTAELAESLVPLVKVITGPAQIQEVEAQIPPTA